jgi:hypothetical protein
MTASARGGSACVANAFATMEVCAATQSLTRKSLFIGIMMELC